MARGRDYVKNARAESEADTRRRIVEAVLALHEEIGPARTTVKAIAERAGVQRLTVYRHLPDERATIAACSAHWSAMHRPPDPTRFTERCDRRSARGLLLELYRYYRGGEKMLIQIFADAPRVAAVAEQVADVPAYLDGITARLLEAWPRPNRARRATLRHAVEFESWRSLARNVADDAAAVDLVFHWADCV